MTAIKPWSSQPLRIVRMIGYILQGQDIEILRNDTTLAHSILRCSINIGREDIHQVATQNLPSIVS